MVTDSDLPRAATLLDQIALANEDGSERINNESNLPAEMIADSERDILFVKNDESIVNEVS